MGDFETEDLTQLKYQLSVKDKRRIEMVTGLDVPTPK